MIADLPRTSRLARALNMGGWAMKEAGVSGPALDLAGLMAAARRRTGLSDFGHPPFEEAAERLTDSLRNEAELNLVGRIAARTDLMRSLMNRLRMQEDSRRNPEIAGAAVPTPLFITGMPRTGTTLLHGLLAQDPRGRSPASWETMYPTPAPEKHRYERDRRIPLTELQLRCLGQIIPEFRRIHPVGAQLPQECLVLTAPSFYSFQFQTMHCVPSYQRWLEEQDLTPAYEGHRNFLQHLQSRCPGDWWVLKAPAHLFGLEALFGVYPDARVVMTHRDPLPVVASLASLTTVLRSAFSDGVDPHAVGREMSERWARGLYEFLRVRDSGRVPHDQVIDVQYRELVADPIGTVRTIYGCFDLELTDEAEKRMRSFLSTHRKDKHGRHQYSLEEFGLDPREEISRYESYAQRFGLDGRRLPQ